MFNLILFKFVSSSVPQELRIPFPFPFKLQKVKVPQPEFISGTREIPFPKPVSGKQTKTKAFQVPKWDSCEKGLVTKKAVQIPLKVSEKEE